MSNVVSLDVSPHGVCWARICLSKIAILLCVVTEVFAVGCSKTKIEPFSASQSGRDYTLGKKVLFGESGDSERYRVSGWSSTEKEITWTEGTLAVLQFTGIDEASPLRIKVTLAALVKPPELPAQPVEVFANGQKIAEWQVAGKSEFTALISPASNKQDNALTIEFKIPKAVSPKDLGLNNDPRVLGVSCFDLTINKVG